MQALNRPITEENFLGYNDRLPPQLLGPGEFVSLVNVRVNDNKIQKVTGTSSIANQIVDEVSTGLAVLENFAAGTKYIVASMNGVSNASWYSWAGSGDFTQIANSDVLTNNKNFNFETAVNVLYGVNGVEVGSWDGTTFTHNPGSIPAAKYIAWFHNYLFVANSSDFPSRLYWSALGAPNDFAGSITGVSVDNGGNSYLLGDIVTITSTIGEEATVSVTSVDGSGAITGISILTDGSGYSVANGYATTGGSGVGATINVTSINTTDAVNFVDINPGDGDEIMGLGVLNDELFVFKRNTIWSVSGFSGESFTVTTVNTQNTNNRIYGYGCVAPNSIVETGDDIYFLSFVGDIPHIRSLTKTQYATTVEGGIITYDISGTMSNLSLPALATTQAIYDGRYIKWAIPRNGASLPNAIIELDTYGISRVRGRTVYPFVQRLGIDPQFFVLSTISGEPIVYFIDWLDSGPYNQGIVYKFDDTINMDLDVQNQIAIEVVTRAYMPDPARKFKWKYLYLKYDTGEISTFDVNSIVDQGDAVNQAEIDLNTGDGNRLDSFILDTSTLGGSAGLVASRRINLAGMTGKMAQFSYFESSNAPFGMYDWEVYTISKPLRAS